LLSSSPFVAVWPGSFDGRLVVGWVFPRPSYPLLRCSAASLSTACGFALALLFGADGDNSVVAARGSAAPTDATARGAPAPKVSECSTAAEPDRGNFFILTIFFKKSGNKSV
jgi:hypothetical protein